jgi:subtilisin family serine protease
MSQTLHRAFAPRSGAIVAALLGAAIGFASTEAAHAQLPSIPGLGSVSNLQNLKDLVKNKKAPAAKVPVVPKKGVAIPGAGGGRIGMPPRGPMMGSRGVPQIGRTGPGNVNPNLSGLPKGPMNVGPGGINPRAAGFGKGLPQGPGGMKGVTANVNPNARFGKSVPGSFGKNGSGAFGKNMPGSFGKTGPGNFAKATPGNFGKGTPGNFRGARTFNRNQFAARTPGGRAFGGPGSRGFTMRNPGMRAVNARTPQLRQVQRFGIRNEIFAMRARMPRIILPGERDFTGIPPVQETRYVDTEMVCQFGPDMSPQQIEEIARRHNLTILWMEPSALTGGTLVQFSIPGGRSARAVVQAMEAERIVSQPNYVYEAVQETAAAADADTSGSDQLYVANKLRLNEVHKIATGKDVVVAVIDSRIDEAHPELAKGIAEYFDAVGKTDKPHTHGTGMAGAIVSQDRLIGVAPGARTLAIHAFATGSAQSPQATTQAIIKGLDWAVNKGARVINMSFAGPKDPMLALALKKASEKGAILIAAVGNAGPKSPPLYPAADPHVIGVTAIDENDKLYAGANIGAQVAVAAPGVDVMVPAPEGAYQLTTGTSVAAAHVSGVAALLLEKHPEADAQLVLEVLTSSATRLGTNKRDDKLGWGLIDPLAALNELDARVADTKVASTTPAAPTAPKAPKAAANPAPAPARAAANAPPKAAGTAQTPAAGATRPALPRPGIYAPKQ